MYCFAMAKLNIKNGTINEKKWIKKLLGLASGNNFTNIFRGWFVKNYQIISHIKFRTIWYIQLRNLPDYVRHKKWQKSCSSKLLIVSWMNPNNLIESTNWFLCWCEILPGKEKLFSLLSRLKGHEKLFLKQNLFFTFSSKKS